MESPVEVMAKVEEKLLKSFPMIDVVLLQHLRKFFILFPNAFYQMKKSLPMSSDGSKISLQKLLKITTHPLEVNRLRRTDILRVIFEGAVLLMLQNFSEYKSSGMFWDSVEIFKRSYTTKEFQNLDAKEYSLLLEFRNLIVAANIVLMPKLDYFINLAVSYSGPAYRLNLLSSSLTYIFRRKHVKAILPHTETDPVAARPLKEEFWFSVRFAINDNIKYDHINFTCGVCRKLESSSVHERTNRLRSQQVSKPRR